MECVVNEHGIAQVPALRAVPGFNIEEELGGAQAFLVEPADDSQPKGQTKARKYTRDEMTALAKTASGSAAAHDEHED